MGEIEHDTHKDLGCELWPSCLGNDEYPQCPFVKCIEDSNKAERKILRRWFLRGKNETD